jgi:O-antigen ligase
VTSPASHETLDFTAAARWPLLAASHLLGAGLLLAVLIALPTAPSDLDRHQLPKETAVHLAVWLAFMLARPFPPEGSSRWMRWALAAVVVISCAAAIFALNPWIALRAASLTITAAAALITARHLAARGLAPLLAGWAIAAATAGALTGLAQAWGADHPFFARTRAPGGTFGNRNFLGHLAAIAMPLTGTTLLLALRTRTAIWTALPVVLLTAALVLTRSRAAWLALLIAALIMTIAIIMTNRRTAIPVNRSRLILLGGSLTLGIVLALVAPNVLNWRSSSPYADTLTDLANYREGSGRGRMVQYSRTLELALAHPWLGVGPGNWALRYGEVAPRNDPSWALNDPVPINPWPSSDLMAVVSERGFPGGAAVLLLIAAIGWRALQGLRRGGARGIGGAGLLGTLAAVMVAGMFDAVLLLPVPGLFVAISLAVLMERADGGPELALPPTRASHPWAIALLVLGLLAARSGQQTVAYAVAGDGSVLRRLHWAARIDPFSYPIRIALAQQRECRMARRHIAAALTLAPQWPAPKQAARRCGVR